MLVMEVSAKILWLKRKNLDAMTPVLVVVAKNIRNVVGDDWSE
jgi:hypothetical protein